MTDDPISEAARPLARLLLGPDVDASFIAAMARSDGAHVTGRSAADEPREVFYAWALAWEHLYALRVLQARAILEGLERDPASVMTLGLAGLGLFASVADSASGAADDLRFREEVEVTCGLAEQLWAALPV